MVKKDANRKGRLRTCARRGAWRGIRGHDVKNGFRTGIRPSEGRETGKGEQAAMSLAGNRKKAARRTLTIRTFINRSWERGWGGERGKRTTGTKKNGKRPGALREDAVGKLVRITSACDQGSMRGAEGEVRGK